MQVIQCLYKIGICTLPTAYLVQFPGIGTVPATYYYHCINVRNLHAKDGCYPTNGHELGAETPIGQGKVDFRAVFTKLHELGYNSYVTIEREIDGPQQLTDILESRTYLQNIIDEIYGEEASC